MATRNPLDKIEILDSIEKDIITCLTSAGSVLQELGKDKSSLKSVENHTTQFLKSLNLVETKLTEQVNYLTQVSTGQPHEGSGYASAKVLQMAWHRIHHVKSRVRELDESKTKYLQNQARSRMIGGVTPGQSAAQNGNMGVVNAANAGNQQQQQQQQQPMQQGGGGGSTPVQQQPNGGSGGTQSTS
ncbi:mediator of RNA polymerase II transcription subunit 11 [Culicoides brevitarsis]|uniref:mediator of RNA polymerase II transcription subunit 11 n=1 Tax=Culicoides brevitarsis TaxID=469753 RepID=UPI00307BD295